MKIIKYVSVILVSTVVHAEVKLEIISRGPKATYVLIDKSGNVVDKEEKMGRVTFNAPQAGKYDLVMANDYLTRQQEIDIEKDEIITVIYKGERGHWRLPSNHPLQKHRIINFE